MEARGAQAVLVGDQDEGPARVAQPEQGGDAVRLEHELVEAVDLLVERLRNERAVAVNEQDFFHDDEWEGCSLCNLIGYKGERTSKVALFSSAVPTVMRIQLETSLLRSRQMTPAVRPAVMALAASATSTSR